MANGGGLMMTFRGDALVCGNPYPCDRVRSVRLFPFESPPPSPPAAPSPPPWSPSVFTSVFEFGGSSSSFHYSSPLWTSDATHSAYDSTWRRYERKTEYTSYVTNMVRLEMTRADTATATSVLLPIDPPASLQSIFNGPYRATTGSEADWRALSGYGTMQPYCNRQGFNIQGQPAYGGINEQRDARIGMYFNDQNDCSSPDTGRVVGGTSRSAMVQGGADVWVTISILMMLVPPSPPALPSPPSPPPAPPLAPILPCRARGYQSAGCSNCAPTSTCSVWGSNSGGGSCCGTGEGYCGSEWSTTDESQWISTCSGLDFIRLWPGCGVEVATGGNGGGSRYTYLSSPLVCGGGCEARPTPGCDRVRSIRLFHIESPPPAPPAMPPAPPGSLRISPDCPEWYDPVNYLYPFCARVG